MKHKCGCCRVICEDGDNGTKFLCEDCKNNRELLDAFTSYRLTWFTYKHLSWFLILYPLLMVVLLAVGGLEWWAWPLCIAAWLVCFRQFRRINWKEKIEGSKEKLWLLKMSE